MAKRVDLSWLLALVCIVGCEKEDASSETLITVAASAQPAAAEAPTPAASSSPVGAPSVVLHAQMASGADRARPQEHHPPAKQASGAANARPSKQRANGRAPCTDYAVRCAGTLEREICQNGSWVPDSSCPAGMNCEQVTREIAICAGKSLARRQQQQEKRSQRESDFCNF